MMLSKPKPSSKKEEYEPPTISSAPENETTLRTMEEQERELERRLALLGVETTTKDTSSSTEPLPSNEKDTMDDESTTLAVEAPSPAAPPIETTKAPAAKTNSSSKTALMARILAAQERAKQMQQQKVSPAAAETKTTTLHEKEKMIQALTVDETFHDPPPPFESLSTTKHREEPPPPFEAIERDIGQAVGAPSAPPVERAALPEPDYLEGVTPILAPPNETEAPPPSFEQFQQQQTDELFDFDLDGNHLTVEQRKKLMEEQRSIMEAIQKEAAENAVAIAAARAENFDQRSNSAAAHTMPANAASSESTITGTLSGRDAVETGVERPERTVEIGGGQRVALHGQERTRAAIAAGTAILVQCINCQNWMQVTESATLMYCPVCSVVSPVIKQTEVLTREEAVQLTMDRRMAERLRDMELGIVDPTTPAVPANQSYMPEFIRAIDRRLRGSDVLSSSTVGSPSRTATSMEVPPASNTTTTVPESPAVTDKSSWWNSFSSMVGVTDENVNNNGRSAEIAVTRPPSSTRPATVGRRTTLHAVHIGENEEEELNFTAGESEGLLNGRNLPSGRVAERQPLFSCVVDSVSRLGTVLTTRTIANDDEEGNVHGIDTSSLLAVTRAGREDTNNNSSSGAYHFLNNDDL